MTTGGPGKPPASIPNQMQGHYSRSDQSPEAQFTAPVRLVLVALAHVAVFAKDLHVGELQSQHGIKAARLDVVNLNDRSIVAGRAAAHAFGPVLLQNPIPQIEPSTGGEELLRAYPLDGVLLPPQRGPLRLDAWNSFALAPLVLFPARGQICGVLICPAP